MTLNTGARQIWLQVANFPFPTPPPAAALRAAERTLINISALKLADATVSAQAATGAQLAVTLVGQAMASLPLEPRHARVVLEAATLVHERRCSDADVLRLAVALAATLSTESPFLHADSAAVQHLLRPAAAPGGADDAQVRRLMCECLAHMNSGHGHCKPPAHVRCVNMFNILPQPPSMHHGAQRGSVMWLQGSPHPQPPVARGTLGSPRTLPRTCRPSPVTEARQHRAPAPRTPSRRSQNCKTDTPITLVECIKTPCHAL